MCNLNSYRQRERLVSCVTFAATIRDKLSYNYFMFGSFFLYQRWNILAWNLFYSQCDTDTVLC